MIVDILERKLNDMERAEREGRLAADARAGLVASLIEHIAAVAEMQAIVLSAPSALLDAELIASTGAPELHIVCAPGHFHTWREILQGRDFRDVGIADLGYEFRAGCVVRISFPAPAEAVAA